MKITSIKQFLLFTFLLGCAGRTDVKSAESAPDLKEKCEQDDAKACLDHGYSFFRENETPTEDQVAEAMVFMEKACEIESAYCLDIGVMWDQGEFVPVDESKARVYYQKACDDEELFCDILINMDRGIPRFPFVGEKLRALRKAYRDGRGEEYLKEQCEKGDGASCYQMSVSWSIGDDHPHDPVKAREYDQKACDLDYLDGCFSLAVDLQSGEGGSKDPVQARKYYEKACKMIDAACFALGMMLRRGEGGPRDLIRAREIFQRLSREGLDYLDVPGALFLGVMLHNGEGGIQDKDKAREYFEKACNAMPVTSGGGCCMLEYVYRNGDGVPQDEVKADEYLKLATEKEANCEEVRERLEIKIGSEGINE